MEVQQTSLEKLQALQLPERQFMVMGSGILEALGIRTANDVDLVVSTPLFNKLRDEDGWRQELSSSGADRLAHTIFQVYEDWFDESEVKNLDQLLVDAEWVDGVAFNSLQKLIMYKSRRGLEKDLQDLELINRYLRA